MQKNTKKNAGGLPEGVIEFENQKYQWKNKSFRLPGDTRLYTSEDALVDLGVLRRLLSIPGQEILKKLH